MAQKFSVRGGAMVGRVAVAGAVLLGSVTGLSLAAGQAAAAPCSGSATGNGSSPLPFIDTGSLGSSDNPSPGPQRPLIPYVGSSTRTVGWLTGPVSDNRTFSRFAVSGTDLGIGWDNGRGQILLAFGDTFGDCHAAGQQWRHNLLFRTDDDDLDDGITVRDAIPGDPRSGSVVAAMAPTYARQLIGSLGISDVEMTTIPTAAISVRRPDGGHRQYINYMSVRSWGSAGHWVTNFSAIAYSDDNGQNWTVDPATALVNSPVSVPLPDGIELPAGLQPIEANNGKFQQSAYFRGHGADAGHLYQVGTPNGRFGAGYLARFRPLDIRNLGEYDYWAGEERGWVDAIAEIPDDGSAIVVPAPVTELSVSWSPYLGKYLMLDGDNGVRMRTADQPQGPWSAPKELLPRGALVVYAPMMMPNSPALQGDSPLLYFNASRWSDYNVMTLRTDLSRVG